MKPNMDLVRPVCPNKHKNSTAFHDVLVGILKLTYSSNHTYNDRFILSSNDKTLPKYSKISSGTKQ